MANYRFGTRLLAIRAAFKGVEWGIPSSLEEKH